jgi:hypothetical protein
LLAGYFAADGRLRPAVERFACAATPLGEKFLTKPFAVKTLGARIGEMITDV